MSGGHINFNNIYIKAMYDHKITIDFALKAGYENNLDLSADATVFTIPEKYSVTYLILFLIVFYVNKEYLMLTLIF